MQLERMMTQPATLITGASRGIGRFLAEHYLDKGHLVAGCSRSSSDLQHPNYSHFTCDIAIENEVIGLFSKVREQFGRLDHLVNNAGIMATSHSLLLPAKTAQRILEVNVLGGFIAAREAARMMQEKRFGRIVSFSTVAVPLKIEGEAIYAASKSGIVTLTQILAKEFSSFGVTVNAVGPTPVRTEILESLPKAKIDQVINRQAIRRWGEFKDVANVVDFFLSPDSDFVTGQVIYLGGVS
jgi:3-oxoacyl-[acyl-carrier protein] reductase